MPRPRKVNVTKEELISLKESGLSIIQIAEKLNCSRKTVTDRMREFGLNRKYLKRKNGAKLVEMAKIYTAEEIAEICGCEVRSVYYWLRMMGISAQQKNQTHLDGLGKIKEKAKEVEKWKKEIFKMYGVWPSDDDKPGTKGLDCRNGKHCRSCAYSAGSSCDYLGIKGERRGCSPWNCTKYKKGRIKRKDG